MDVWTHTLVVMVWTFVSYYIGYRLGGRVGFVEGISGVLQMLLDKNYINVKDIENINDGKDKEYE
jgi:hypothetical protein